ncbi:hypothetical protein TDB9533_00685 [Thalassocella blandensis]|nr:hypothetical protein TDB9533_00685 [Thalassocella blandensis]
MSNVVPITQRSTIEDEASLWVVRVERGLSDEEKIAFKKWIATSKVHQEEFFSLVKFWDETEVLGKLAHIVPKEQMQKQTQQRAMSIKVSAFAASFILVICAIGFITVNNTFTSSPQNGELFSALLHTEVGKQHIEYLPDNSILHMNTDTVVRIEFGRDFRLIKLQKGEVLVDVAHNAQRPLVVVAGKQAVKAVGTAFNVRVVDEDQIKVVITDGQVVVGQLNTSSDDITEQVKQTFQQSDQKTSLSEGDMAILQGRERHLKRLNKKEMDMEVAWKSGHIIFSGEPLEFVVQEISRYTSVQFEFADASLKTRKVAGIFQTGDLKGFINALEENLDIQATRISDRLFSLDTKSRKSKKNSKPQQ